MARLLTNIVLVNLDMPPLELQVETKMKRQDYIRALQAADKGEYIVLEGMFRKALEEAVKEI